MDELHNEEKHNLHISPHIVSEKSRIQWPEQIEFTREMRKAQGILVRTHERKRFPGRGMSRWGNILRYILKTNNLRM
jgi:hypothetical protein